MPKFSGSSILSSFLAKESLPQTLSCPAQGSPVPAFRCAISIHSPLKEPVGGSAPKLNGVSVRVYLLGKVSQPQTLTCPAQGAPVPAFRFVHALYK